MKQIIKTEIFKLLHRYEAYIIVLLVLLAFGLPIGFKLAPSSYAIEYSFGDGRIPRFAYMVIGYSFWGTLGIYILLFSLLSVVLSSKEIESHYFYLYFPRVSNRGKIYSAKFFVVALFAVLWYLAYTLLFNPIGHGIMCAFRPDLAVNIFSDGSDVFWQCMWIVSLFELLFYIGLAIFLGTKLKPLTTISMVMVFYYASIFINNFPVIKYLLPAYYQQQAMNYQSTNNFNELLLYTALYIIISLAYNTVFFVYGKRRMKCINA